MNDKVATNAIPLTRDQIRKAIVGARHAPAKELVTLFGCEIELRQPTLASILASREEDDEKRRITDVFINYAYVPGTDEHVFEDGDRDVILNWPFTEELVEVQLVIAKLTGVDLGGAEEEIKADPLDESS